MTQMRMNTFRRRLLPVAAVALCLCPWAAARSKQQDSTRIRDEYIARVQQQQFTPEPAQNGSLWSPDSALQDLASDYKAHRLNDTVIITVSESTSARSTGDVNQNRSLSASSAVTGLAGGVSTKNVNPIVAANSSQKLKGSGSANSSSTLRTNLSGQVIALLPNGNMVVEAQRKIVMNNQHETMVVRGVIRPGDISKYNMVPSTALMNLEVELKGKGVVSDATRPPNPVVRALLWVIGF
jgi:flagellar L-ring protein precursor FlgH